MLLKETPDVAGICPARLSSGPFRRVCFNVLHAEHVATS